MWVGSALSKRRCEDTQGGCILHKAPELLTASGSPEYQSESTHLRWTAICFTPSCLRPSVPTSVEVWQKKKKKICFLLQGKRRLKVVCVCLGTCVFGCVCLYVLVPACRFRSCSFINLLVVLCVGNGSRAGWKSLHTKPLCFHTPGYEMRDLW